MSANTPLKNGKDTVFEGGIRTPAIVRWPGKTAVGAVSQQPVAVHDLFPTIFAALTLPLPGELKLDGSNQWSALSTGKTLARPAFLIAMQDIAFIDGDWKIIETSDGQRSLFNLAKDIGEEKDLASEQGEVLKSLGTKLDELKKGLPVASAGRGAGPAGKGPGAAGAGKGPAGKGKGVQK
jgi:arylsulfatase A-like enzyme